MVDAFAISVRLAGMLLLRNAQIALDEIEALPFVNSHQEAQAVALRLLDTFKRQYPMELAANPGQTDLRLRGCRLRGGQARYAEKRCHPDENASIKLGESKRIVVALRGSFRAQIAVSSDRLIGSLSKDTVWRMSSSADAGGELRSRRTRQGRNEIRAACSGIARPGRRNMRWSLPVRRGKIARRQDRAECYAGACPPPAFRRLRNAG